MRPSMMLNVRNLLVPCILAAVPAAVQAEELRFRVVDAVSGAPIANVEVKRLASQWQPRILLLPGKFWFPREEAATDASGVTSFKEFASDDHFSFNAAGYEPGAVNKSWFKYRFRSGTGPASEVAERSGALVIPMRWNSDK
jgi:hypothetical protein